MPVTVQEAIEIVGSFSAKLPEIALSTLGEIVGYVQEDMGQPGEPVSYPIRWDSDRQRKAAYASNNWGKGFPYERTGEYGAAWQTKPITDGYELSNTGEHKAAAIGGYPFGAQWQSSIHSGRWVKLADTMNRLLAYLPNKVIEKVKAAWSEAVR